MADTGGPPREPGLEARVARLEPAVAHIRGDVSDMKSTLRRLAPIIHEIFDIFAVVGLLGAVLTIASHFAH